jgi:hypothetical protein
MTMKTPMSAALVGQGETVATFLRRILLRIKALVGHYARFAWIADSSIGDMGIATSMPFLL